jgi:hypothetical protein
MINGKMLANGEFKNSQTVNSILKLKTDNSKLIPYFRIKRKPTIWIG